jgi:hypothetical protein
MSSTQRRGIHRLHPIGGFFICYGMGVLSARTVTVIRIPNPERLDHLRDAFLERFFRLFGV